MRSKRPFRRSALGVAAGVLAGLVAARVAAGVWGRGALGGYVERHAADAARWKAARTAAVSLPSGDAPPLGEGCAAAQRAVAVPAAGELGASIEEAYGAGPAAELPPAVGAWLRSVSAPLAPPARASRSR